MTSTTSHSATRTSALSPAALLRWSGLAAMVAGVVFAGIQPFHPPDTVASVGTAAWAVITPLKTVMCVLLLVGVTGLYARQVRQVGWPGLVGYVVFSLGWAVTSAYVFAETFVVPPLVGVAPTFVDAFLGVAAGRRTDLDLGAVPTLFMLSGVAYMLGGLIFGVATFRARVFPRWAAGLMAATAALTPLAALLPHATQRFAAVPMGVALIGLGYALWTGRAEPDAIRRSSRETNAD